MISIFTTEQLAAIIKHRREEYCLTMADLATAANITKQTVHQIEKGKCSPRAGTLIALLKALDLHIVLEPKEIDYD